VRYWKLLGLAGLAGVTATGAVIVRAERRRQAFAPDDVRARLHQRYEAANAGGVMPAGAVVETAAPQPAGRHHLWRKRKRR
jgi:hypothetical protein